jgi:spore maturation protein CgeB
MKILLACMLHSYGNPKRERSYEYFNFYLTLLRMGHEVELFDYMDELNSLGREAMNRKLLNRVQEIKPDLAIFSLYTDQLDPIVINQLRQYTLTYCFFHDDTWRAEYSRSWARHFDFFSSPDAHGPLKYRRHGLDNCIYFPFGCNEQIFRPRSTAEKKYDVSFIGSWHPYREWVINRIRKAGIRVAAAGFRWAAGEVSQDQMVDYFNQSKINLNLSNSASWDLRYLTSSSKAIVNRLLSKKNVEQMKARIFEINSCGGFQLSYYVEGIANCFVPDHEIVIYADADDLIDKIRFYLEYDELREAIASAGYSRAIRDHTFVQRFENVFAHMGFPRG